MLEETLSVETVRTFLLPHGIPVQEISDDTSTADLAARALGTTVASIVKSLLFIADGEALLVLVAGDRKINARQLAKELGVREIRLARPDAVMRITGYAVGGVPPVAHRQTVRTLMDRHLLELDTVYAAAGTSNAIFVVGPDQLRAMTAAQIVNAAE